MAGSVTSVPVNTMVPNRFRMVDGIDAAVRQYAFHLDLCVSWCAGVFKLYPWAIREQT
jgi:hypothetical protein